MSAIAFSSASVKLLSAGCSVTSIAIDRTPSRSNTSNTRAAVIAALFFGLKAAVLAIVLQAVMRIGKRALRNTTMRLIAAFAFVAIFFAGVPFPLIVLTAGIVGFVGGRRGSQQAGGSQGEGERGAEPVTESHDVGLLRVE